MMNDKKNSSAGVGFFSIQDIINGVNATEAIADTTIAAGAKVVCTAATGCRSASQMVKGASCLLLQKSIELGHKDTEFLPLFPSCMVGDHVCKPEIERGEWQDYDETKFTSTGDHSLLKDKSYMLCTKGFGIIYASDNGQKIDERQAQSMAILFQRWQDNPDKMGYLKGISSCHVYSKDPVNLNTGNFIYQHEDFKLTGFIPLVLRRFYNAQDNKTGAFGAGWMHNYEMHLEFNRNHLLLCHVDGREERYQKISEERYRSEQTGVGMIVVEKQGIERFYVYVAPDQNHHFFDQKGREYKREDLNGNQITFTYNYQDELEQVTGGSGSLYFQYKEGRLSAVADHTGREVRYEYDGERLAEVIDPAGHTMIYHYGENGKIEEVVNPRGIQMVGNTYDTDGRITRQQFPDGGEMTYCYHEGDKMVEMTEQNGNKVRHYYDNRYRNIKTEYEDGKEEFIYNDKNHKIQYKDKRGNLTRYEYDQHGNETRQVDALGNQLNRTYNQQSRLLTISVNGVNKLKNVYDQKGNLIKFTDGMNQTREFRYQGRGQVSEFWPTNKGQYRFAYDERGNLIRVTDPEDYQIQYEYDTLNRVSATMDANGNRLCYEYDSRNNLIKVTRMDGKQQSYTYNEQNKVTSFTDYHGGTICQEYGVLNKPNKITDALGNETLLEYDLMWNVSQVTDANKGVIRYDYNQFNQLKRVIYPSGGTVEFSYDENANRTKIVGFNGEVTTFTYDALNRVTQIVEPNNAMHRYEYDGEGQVISYWDALGQNIRYEYDNIGRKTKEINVLGEETDYHYHPIGKLDQISKAGVELVRYKYDLRGLLTEESHLDGSVFRYSYDGNQNLIQKIDQRGYQLTYTYDNFDRVVRICSNHGQDSSYQYDAAGNVTEMVDANGNRIEYLYDLCGNLIGVIDANGNQTAYGYDGTGKMTHIVQGEDKLFDRESLEFDLEEVWKCNQKNHQMRITSYQRNLSGQVEQVIDPLGNSERYQYDKAGKLLSKTDKDGYQTSYRYDAVGELSKIIYEDGREVKFHYDALHQLVAFEDWLGISRIELDALGRVAKVTDHQAREVSYGWGALNERTSITYSDGNQVCYDYDPHLRLKQVRGIETQVDYRYDQWGDLREKTFADGLKTTYDYNVLGQLERLRNWNHSVTLDDYQYRYDALGNKVEIEKQRSKLPGESGVYRYQYDSLNQLSKVEKDGHLLRNYRYDCYGNRVELLEGQKSTKYSYNILNQLISKTDIFLEREVKNERYDYDKRGNLTKFYQNEKLLYQYRFGELNRLENAFNYKTNLGAGYQYNGLGKQVGKIEGMPLTSEIPTINLMDMELVLTKKTEDILDMTKQYNNLLQRVENSDTTSFIWGNNVLSKTGTEGTYHYFQDELGSPIRTVDKNKSQTIYGYNEFGQDLYQNQMATQPFGYTGYQRSDNSNILFAQARHYDPTAGRFVSEDQIKGFMAYPFTLNSYTYCWNSPMNLVDLDGLAPFPITKEEGKEAHTLLQGYLFLLFPNNIKIEYPIPGSGPNGGTGRADVIYYNPIGVQEVYEIKPGSHAPGAVNEQKGLDQRDRYINNLENSIPGVTLFPFVDNKTIPSVLHPGYDIKYHTYVTNPGMIYYNYVKGEKQPQENPSTQPVTKPVYKPVEEPKTEPIGVNWGYVAGAGLVLAGAIGWVASVAGTPFTGGTSLAGGVPSTELITAGIALFIITPVVSNTDQCDLNNGI